MYNKAPYVMRDQVKNLVPNLMSIDVEGGRRRAAGPAIELAVFAATTLSFLLALSITA